MYVDNFSAILGKYNSENELLKFAKKHNIQSLILYDLNKIHKRFPLGNAEKNQILADFITRAKLDFGIKEISASGESGDFFIKAIHPYNKSRKKAIEKFDVYNLEYEYWHPQNSLNGGYYCNTYLKKAQVPCSRNGSFKYYVETLSIMKLLAEEETHPIKVEAYIGGFTREEAIIISKYADRLLVHVYVNNPQKGYNYAKKRLDLLSEIKSNVAISFIFSAEPNFMGSWLKKKNFKKAEQIFLRELKDATKKNKFALNFEGFTYYNYGFS
jgi:hypothetical protein